MYRMYSLPAYGFDRQDSSMNVYLSPLRVVNSIFIILISRETLEQDNNLC